MSMTDIFIAVVLLVVVVGVGLSMTRVAWPFAVAEDLGRTGSWFHHMDMDAAEAQPDPSANDAPIPHRPLRGRA